MQCGMRMELSSAVQFANKNFVERTISALCAGEIHASCKLFKVARIMQIFNVAIVLMASMTWFNFLVGGSRFSTVLAGGNLRRKKSADTTMAER